MRTDSNQNELIRNRKLTEIQIMLRHGNVARHKHRKITQYGNSAATALEIRWALQIDPRHTMTKRHQQLSYMYVDNDIY